MSACFSSCGSRSIICITVMPAFSFFLFVDFLLFFCHVNALGLDGNEQIPILLQKFFAISNSNLGFLGVGNVTKNNVALFDPFIFFWLAGVSFYRCYIFPDI